MPELASSVRILLTASEAYPALERAFLAATSEIWASFLVFDLSTSLRSPEALQIGKTWFDLIVHCLNRGVSINICISEVDPVARAAMHRGTSCDVRTLEEAAAAAGPVARMSAVRALHPARTSALIRMALWVFIMKKLYRTAGWLNKLAPEDRAAALQDMDGAAKNLKLRPDGRVGVRLWSLPQLHPLVHHQKLAVFDRKRLYIGGLDLDERRYDTPNHRRSADQTRHDVQLMIEGSVVAEAQKHLETFRDVIAGVMPPPRTRRLLRTISRPQRDSLWRFGPDPLVNELQNAHLVLAKRARQLIYLESQYFRDQDIARALAACGRRQKGLQLILILPAAPDDVAFDGRRGLDARFGEAMQAHALRILRKGLGDRLFVGSPAQPRRALPDGNGPSDSRRDRLQGAPVIYVHAKVSIFDDAAGIVSSANLNSRSMRWDTEAGVYLNTRNDVLELRHRVMAHWLPADVEAEAFNPGTARAIWTRIARANASVPPAERKGFLLPHDFAAAEAFGRKVPILPPEFV